MRCKAKVMSKKMGYFENSRYAQDHVICWRKTGPELLSNPLVLRSLFLFYITFLFFVFSIYPWKRSWANEGWQEILPRSKRQNPRYERGNEGFWQCHIFFTDPNVFFFGSSDENWFDVIGWLAMPLYPTPPHPDPTPPKPLTCDPSHLRVKWLNP